MTEALQDLKRQVEEQGRFLRDQGARYRNTDRYEDSDDRRRDRDRDATRLRERDRERERDRDKDRQAERDRDRERERLRWEQTYYDPRFQPYQARELPCRGFDQTMVPPPQPRIRHGPPPPLPMMPMPMPMPMMMPPRMAGPAARGFGNGQGQGMYYDEFGMRGPCRRRKRPPFMCSPDVQQMKSDPTLTRQAQPNATQNQDDASFDRLRPGGFGPRTRFSRAKPKFSDPPMFGGNGGEGLRGGNANNDKRERDIMEDFFAESNGNEGRDNTGNSSYPQRNLSQRAQRRRDFKNFGGGGSRGVSCGGDQSPAEDGHFQQGREPSREPVIEEVDEDEEDDEDDFGNAANDRPDP